MALSFWIAASLPVDASSRLLIQEAPTFRMRCGLLMGMLRDLGELHCNECGSAVASQEDVFSLSQTGAAGTFVNPNGYVHQMLTLQSLAPESFVPVGEPETAHSWFPGYAWTICNCSTCFCHLGWMFTATPRPLKPAVFYGIRHMALRVSPVVARSQTRDEGLQIIAVGNATRLSDAPHLQNNALPPTAMLRAWYLAAQQRLQRLVEGTFAEEEEGTGGGGDDAHGRGRGDGGDRGEANNDVIFEGSVLEEDVSKEDDD